MRRGDIALALIMVTIVAALFGLMAWREVEAHACHSRGGHYVREFDGWTCIQ